MPSKSGKKSDPPDFKKLYKEFTHAFTRAFSRRDNTFGKDVQVELNSVWNSAKKQFVKDDRARADYIEQCIFDYNIECNMPKTTGRESLLSPFQKARDKLNERCDQGIVEKSNGVDGAPLSLESDQFADKSKDLEVSSSSSRNSRSIVPSESEVEKNIFDSDDTYVPQRIERWLSAQLLACGANLGGDTSNAVIEETQKNLSSAKRSLESTQNNAAYQQTLRKKRKMIQASQSCGDSNDTGDLVQGRVGRPSLDIIHPELHDTIIQIASFGAAAHGRRHTDEFRAPKTLDDLRAILNARLGINISRTAVYLRLLPRRSNTIEGKRHIKTCPVRLCRALNDEHRSHPDTQFCIASLRYLEAFASALGPQQVAYISQDDKARVALGITAANKQSPILMPTEYRVKLPDHDFVVAQKHKLIPSVYAGIEIKADGLGNPEAVSYSGPTYIAIRSGKHDSSTAFSHAADFKHLLQIAEFDDIMKYQDEIKPIVIVNTDGGPDGNPRYSTVISAWVSIFLALKGKVDCIFVAPNAPGRSCFNRAGRRMAALSKELSDLILDHAHYGNQLDGSKRTIDMDLERRNFQKAGETLAEIWSAIKIDDYPVVAEFVSSEELPIDKDLGIDGNWYATHVKESQYSLQVMRLTISPILLNFT
ncbi:hypothetical protein QAD02_013571 [Eretmocerus hayati]|uniref:Uncharacterized protein n=1 Tax=Eretmocerus hayati TaxID=131215 RepID=A0ACC2P2I6_9HYME|nr:hypothetical protein QAD02_013571 [Eretmocerus hayati]